MPSLIKLPIVSIAAVFFLAGCASPFKVSRTSALEIYYKDGRVAYVTSCKSASWGDCLNAAGSVCKDAGYTILEKSDKTYSYDENKKEMVFSCNVKSDAVELLAK